jgi:hypothetical protein
MFSGQVEEDECYIIDPKPRYDKNSKQLAKIKLENLSKENESRSEYKTNAKL